MAGTPCSGVPLILFSTVVRIDTLPGCAIPKDTADIDHQAPNTEACCRAQTHPTLSRSVGTQAPVATRLGQLNQFGANRA